MSGGERLIVRDLLIGAGYPADWVSAKAAHVSRIYYHHRRPGAKAAKDGAGIAVYGPEDRAGLLDVAPGAPGRGRRPAGAECGAGLSGAGLFDVAAGARRALRHLRVAGPRRSAGPPGKELQREPESQDVRRLPARQ